GEAEEGQQFIETVPKKGYRFVVPVEQVRDESLSLEDSAARASSESDLSIEPAAKADPKPFRMTGFLRAVLGVCLLVIVAIGSAYLVFHQRVFSKPTSKQAHRLAVLPFQNLQANTESDFLGFSLADAIITKLGYVSELSVRPSYAVQKYKGQV